MMSDNYFISVIKDYLDNKDYEPLYPFIKDFLEVIENLQNKSYDFDKHILDFHVHLSEFNYKVSNHDIIIKKLETENDNLKNQVKIQEFGIDNLNKRIDKLTQDNTEQKFKINDLENKIKIVMQILIQ
jgi:predicted RNase H-like nuclease (RuvC/YqgF family)